MEKNTLLKFLEDNGIPVIDNSVCISWMSDLKSDFTGLTLLDCDTVKITQDKSSITLRILCKFENHVDDEKLIETIFSKNKSKIESRLKSVLEKKLACIKDINLKLHNAQLDLCWVDVEIIYDLSHVVEQDGHLKLFMKQLFER